VRLALPIRLLFVALFAPVFLLAQEYNFRYFGVAEGLTNLAVRQIFQDRAGFLWVSTENGVFRYDRDRFEAFGPERGLPVTSGAAFGEAPDGSLLVGGDFGLFNLIGNRFERVPIPAQSVNWVQGIQSDGKGRTFIATDAGLLQLTAARGLRIDRLPQPPGASGANTFGVSIETATGAVWYGCGHEVCRMDGGGTAVLGRESALPEVDWLAVRKDPGGNLWVRGRHVGVFVLPSGKRKFERPASPSDPNSLGGALTMDEDGRVLFPAPSGLFIRDGAAWQTVDRSVGLRGTVYSAYEDRQHSLWIGLAGRGLARWRGYREWESYTVETGLASDIVYEIASGAQGSLWLATEGGLFRGFRRAAGAFEWRKFPGIGNIPVHSVQQGDDGNFWIGTESRGIARIRAHTGVVDWIGATQGLAGKASYALRFDRKHRLWVVTESGLFMSTAPYQHFAAAPSLPSKRFWTIAEGTDGVIWAGGSAGLFSYDDGVWHNYSTGNGLSNQEVISLGVAPGGEIWVGYRFGGGIDRVRRTPGGIDIAKGVQRPGTVGIVYFLQFDRLGQLWAGTERGVDVWNGSYWSHYDTSDGLAWDDCNLNGFYSDPDGTIWIGTSGGLSRFKPRAHSSGRDPQPDVVFTTLVLGTKDVTGQKSPSVGIKSNSLLARFSALNCPRENGVVFRYRLAAENAKWTDTTQREVQFAELPPGSYRLEVEARNSDGAWTGRRAQFPFTIQTPWYRSWWFLLLGTCLPIFLAFFLVRLRMAASKQRERELVRAVDEKTTDLRRANEDLLRLSSLDPLTGLANRRIFDQALARECSCLVLSESQVSLLMVDVDHFKALNDSEGHQRGDDYLIRVGTELRRLARRQRDVVARYGGEEFAVILPGTGTSDALQFADSLRRSIAALGLPHPASPVAGYLTVSVGVATASNQLRAGPEQILAAADEALFRAKRNGRNRLECAEFTEAVPVRPVRA
jgi:diguanylate cyclase (GGDEF)-like protein